MSAIPIPMQEIEDDTSDDQKWKGIPYSLPEDQKQSFAKPIPVAQSSAQDAPTAPAARAIPQAPVTPTSGSLEDLENMVGTLHPHAAVPIQTGVASLWSKAKNIHNPVLRVLGEIGAGGARVLDTIGTIAAPRIAAAIPGSTLNQRGEQERQQKQETEDAAIGKTKADTSEAQARADAIAHPKPVADKPQTPQQVLAGIVAEDIDSGRATGDDPRYQQAVDAITDSQRELGPQKENDFEKFYKDFLTDGNLPDSAHNRLMARKQFAQAGQAPPQPQRTLLAVPQPDGSQKLIEATPGMTIPGTAAKPGEVASASRKDITAHDKAYVQPAEQVEKSYQMMDSAYREYETARAQGKSLPTGAQSMLALSTHLATTFGNVKGSRVTKDMIQEHLGARSVSDSALVAIQKLTNGDVLSPAQWDAFHDLISNSRKLSWQIAAKEADRKRIPIDFLPEDLKGLPHDPGQEELKPPKTADAGMKWQHRTVDGKTEWRQVKQ